MSDVKFVEIKGGYFNLSAILSVRKAPKRTGTDGVTRNWIIQVTPYSIGGSMNPKHSSLWCSDEEVTEVLAAIKGTMVMEKTV